MRTQWTLTVVACSLLLGCASDIPPIYYSDTADKFPPKPNQYDPPIFREKPEKPFRIIGRAGFSSSTFQKISGDLKKLARQQGADAVWVMRISQSNEAIPYNVPPSVEYHPTVTNQTGVVNTYGPYGSPTTSTYSGTQTSGVTTVTPGYSGVRNIQLISGAAVLIVFTKDGSSNEEKPE